MAVALSDVLSLRACWHGHQRRRANKSSAVDYKEVEKEVDGEIKVVVEEVPVDTPEFRRRLAKSDNNIIFWMATSAEECCSSVKENY